MEPTIYVIAADSNVQNSYRGLFETAAMRMEVCRNIDAALNAAERGPCCALLELDKPDPDTLARLDAPRKFRNLPVIVVHSAIDVALAVAAMRRGAWDFLVKPVPDTVLLNCVRQAIESDQRHFRAYQLRRQWSQRMDNLTPRERQVMQLVVNGNANKQIAARIRVSVKTVEVHRARVMKKMDAGSLAQLVIQGIQLGMVENS